MPPPNGITRPRGRSILPLTFAPCEFIDDGLPHKILTQGGGHGAVDCNGLNPSNQIIPGGFAWLAPDGNTGCEVTAEVGQWSITSAGASMPTGCDAIFNSALVGTDSRNSGLRIHLQRTCSRPAPAATCKYMIEKWAGFEGPGLEVSWQFL